MPLEEALKLISPVHRISEMPDIPYLICGDTEDEVFFIDGMEEFKDKMLAAVLE